MSFPVAGTAAFLPKSQELVVTPGVAAHAAIEGTVTEFGSMVALADRFNTSNANGFFALNSLGQVTATGAYSSSFANCLLIPLPTVRNHFSVRVRYQINIAPTITSYGLGVFLRSINTYSPGTDVGMFLASVNFALGAAQIIQGTTGVTASNTEGTFGIASGDVLEIEFGCRGVTLFGYARNLTQGCSRYVEATHNLTNAGNFGFPNTSEVGISFNGGTYTITDVSFVSHGLAAPGLFVLGDSKALGSQAGILEGTWARIVARTNGYTLRVEAGGGDRTIEAAQTIQQLSLAPTICINAIGFNDIASGVASATWQANYEAITARMLIWGGPVYHLLPIPSTTANTSALRAWQLATYPGLTIDPAQGFNTSTMLDSDGTHPNPLGHQYVASVVATFLAAQA